MAQTFKTQNNEILEVGKKYRWSGTSDGLYTSYTWKKFKCKITKIETNKVFVYDYDDNTEVGYTDEDLKRQRISFKSI